MVYNKDNQLQTQTTNKGSTLTVKYDKIGREKIRSYKNATNDIIYQSSTKYDRNSNIISETENKKIVSNNKTILKRYTYDDKDQIKTFTQTDDIYQIARNNTYTYDKASNIIGKTLEDNIAKQTKEILSQVNEDITYDENGNITQYKNKIFRYDFLNRVVEVKDGTSYSTIVSYSYDAQNRRVQKVLRDKTITYLYHKEQVIQEYVTQDNTQILSNTYLYGGYIDDAIAYFYNEKIYYYVKDSRYSTMAITDSNSNVVERYEYSPYGVTTIFDSNNNPLVTSRYNNSYGYTGRRYDSESEVYYYRNRIYNPELGRFFSKDPKGYVDGMNLYAYVKNNPLKYLDPMGTSARSTITNSHIGSSDLGNFELLLVANVPKINDRVINAISSGFDSLGDTAFDVAHGVVDTAVDIYYNGVDEKSVIKGVEYVNTVSYPAAVASAYTGNVYAAGVFAGTGYLTDWILYEYEKKSGQAIARETMIDVIKPPGLKGEIVGTAVKETTKYLENEEKEKMEK